MGTQEERREATRQALIVAATTLFNEQGVDGPSLDAICMRAGYTRGAFYVHFADREALLIAVMEHTLAAWVTTIVETANTGGDLQRSIHQFAAMIASTDNPSSSPFVAAGTAHLPMLLETCRRSETFRARFLTLMSVTITRLTQVVEASQAASMTQSAFEASNLAVVLVTLVFGMLTLRQTGFEHDVGSTADTILTMLTGQPTQQPAAS
ncbi:MAG: TetR/AcrR family transcriptional repressor of nem operon [Myxococcota bacterium]|jgi:TetR/AcrR family transcriptional repressor of nem operon